MIRLLLRAALLIAAALAMALFLIRAPSYDARVVSDFFGIASCSSMPCWQGIRPGETTLSQALAILQRHSWIGTISQVNNSTGLQAPVTITWTWSSAYPLASALIVSQQGIIITDHGLVQQIYLTTNIPFGDMWLALGGPDGGTVGYVATSHRLRIDDTALFSHDGVAATASLFTDCSFDNPNLWQTPVYLWLQSSESLGTSNVAYPVYLRMMRTGYQQVRAAFC